MKELRITAKDAGQRLNKYLGRIMPAAGSGFLYKMLRKKNITLNDGKAEGNETLREGDIVRVYFSDETYAKMSGTATAAVDLPFFALHPVTEEQIVYEDEDLMAVYKPSGVLSQKDDSGEEAFNEQVLQYLADRGDLTAETIRTFKPGICNRLDRNTAGIVWFAKTLRGAQGMAEALRGRIFGKFYFALLVGRLNEPKDTIFRLTKNRDTNTVSISEIASGKEASESSADSEIVHTGIVPVAVNRHITLAKIQLFTGKSHQIRSVCRHIGYPVLGDPKYGTDNAGLNGYFRTKYHLHGQQLFAYSYEFPRTVPAGLEELAGETITGIVPDKFSEILSGEFPGEEFF